MLTDLSPSRSRLESVTQAVRLAHEAISRAGSLAHSDPDDAWSAVVDAKEYCFSALEHLASISAGSERDIKTEAVVVVSSPSRSQSAIEVSRLLALLRAAVQAEHADEDTEEAMPLTRNGENTGLVQLAIINHVGDLCRLAVEEGVAAHELAAQASVRDAVWNSVKASMEAMYALLLIGAALPDDAALDDTDFDLAALHLVDKAHDRASTRAAARPKDVSAGGDSYL